MGFFYSYGPISALPFAKDGIFPVVSPLVQYCQRWDSGCVTYIAELLPKMGFWVVSMAALRLAKMGFSGCVPHCSNIAKDGILQSTLRHYNQR
jgi:hypothetical protein